MKDNSQETPKSLSKRSHSISKYAAQCGKCFKWRLFDTQEEFEDIRSKFIEEPFYCDRKLDVSCEDPADIEYDASRTWVIDKPNIPKTPEGFKRILIVRKDFSKLDSYYSTPTGKKCRTRNEIAQFIKENPEYEDVSLSDFDFSTPKVMEDTIPEHVVRKASANGSSNKRLKSTKG
ncbi:methyl-CpG-binding domain-containing protein 4-like isoform X1 [Juglans microcarpa x Juglans regia]|uniref:methyl-CpG-binding domain-containing protein 4-like isoform X1 n=1 Tax=Juglans microcarpa x Juglans regia TaxID=2249226 RepID=UPI001B7EFEAF|nr:methyl-CpG-binding domain-containing protein 4-like isoform X1 [Juglans microcarpa x Juglans regia]